jgi:hypothetical protein
VTLTWTAPTGAASYNVYRGTTAGGEGATPVATGVTGTTYTDTRLTIGTAYFYKVTAVNANPAPLPSESAPSAEVSATPSDVAPPAAPTNLKASTTAANTSTPKVVLTWTGSAGATSYNVYRSIDGNGEGGTPLATGVTGTSYTDRSGAFGTTYFYKVSAVNAGGAGPLSNEASATPLFRARVNFTASGGDAVAGYFADTGLAYGKHDALTYGWNQDNTANGRDRNAANSPDELHDSLAHMQKPNNPNAWWGIAVPDGTYSVHLIAGDPSNIDSVYRINVGGTLNPTTRTVTGGVLAVSGTPTSSTHWFENTVTVTVSGGVLYVSNASGSSNNKLDAITVTQVLAGAHFSGGFASTAGLGLNGSAKQSGTALRLTDGANNEAGSAFTATALDVAKFTTSFDFRLTNPNADGITFTLQGVGATALGASGGGLGYGTDGTNPGNTIGKSVAIKFDLYNNQGEGVNSTGLFLNGASPTSAGSVNLAGTGIDLHSGHAFNVTMSYDGVTLKVTIKDKVTGATATQSYTVDIVKAVGGSTAFVGFTGGTGGLTATEDILAWDYSPVA